MEEQLLALSPPGTFIAFSYFFFAALFVWLNRRRLPARTTLLIQLGCGAGVLLLARLIDSRDPRFYLLRFLFFLGLALGQIWALAKISLAKSAYFFAHAFVLAEFTTALDWHLYYFGVNVKAVPDVPKIRIPFFLAIYGGVWALAFLMNLPSRTFYRESAIRKRDLVRVYILAVLVFLAANVSNVFQETPFSSSVPGEIFLLRVLMNLTGVVSMHLLQVTLREEESRRQAEGLQRMMEQMYLNYQISERSIERVSLMCHDLKHQLRIIQRSGVSTEDQGTLDQMERDIADFESQEKTGSQVLDTVLMSARLASRDERVEITCVADGKLLSFLSPMDASALFGNLTDNALEAVRALPEGTPRLIRLTVEAKKGFVVIGCANTYAGVRQMEGGLPLTTKADPDSHGFGTLSIRKVAEKYGGTARFWTEGGWFRVKVLLPTTQEEIGPFRKATGQALFR